METKQPVPSGLSAAFTIGRRFSVASATLICLSFVITARGYETDHYANGAWSGRGRELTLDRFRASVARLEAVDQDGTFPVTVGATTEGPMIGGEFDLLFELRDAQTPGARVWLEILGGLLHYHQDAGATGTAIWHYDGIDGNPVHVVASEGLGRIDLTKHGKVDRFAVGVFSNAAPIDLSIVVFSSTEDASEITTTIPATEQPGTIRLPFSDLVASGGNGADLTAVTAIVVVIGASGFTGEADLVLSGITATGDPRAAKVLRSQLRGRVDTWNYAVNFPGENPFDFEVADDFTVPVGQTWSLGGLWLAGTYVPAPPAGPALDVTVYTDNGGMPGAEVFHEAGVGMHPANAPGTWEALFGEALDLSEGHYWLAFQGVVPVGTELRVYESEDFDANDTFDRPYAARNQGGALAPDCRDWTAGIECNGQQFSLALAILAPAPSETGKAYADHYESFGNVGISVPCVSGLLANDELTAGPVIDYDTPTINGAAVNVTADGGFDYAPALGFRGQDSFTYTRQDGSSATVHICVRRSVWALNNDPQVAAGSANVGTLADPFISLDAFKTAAPSLPGDIIFLFPGTYFGALDLQEGQVVASKIDGFLADEFNQWGDSGPLNLPATFEYPQERATIQATDGNAVNLAWNNLLVGVNVGAASGGYGLKANNFGRLTLYDVGINGSAGGLDLLNGQLQAKYTDVSVAGGEGPGLRWTYGIPRPDGNDGPPHKGHGYVPEFFLAYSNVFGRSGGVEAHVYGSASVDVVAVDNVVQSADGAGLTVTCQQMSMAAVVLNGNEVTGQTWDFVLNPVDDSSLTLGGFTGSDAAAAIAFLQDNNIGAPTVFLGSNIQF